MGGARRWRKRNSIFGPNIKGKSINPHYFPPPLLRKHSYPLRIPLPFNGFQLAV